MTSAQVGTDGKAGGMVWRVQFEYNEARRAVDKSELEQITQKANRASTRLPLSIAILTAVVSAVFAIVGARILTNATIKAAIAPALVPATSAPVTKHD
jgi:Ca2+/Na+ antiporter